jgi:hypothetical protein
MSTHKEWAESEFGTVDIGDVRRTRRLVKVAASVATSERGTLPPVCPSWGDLKAAYRLLAEEDVTHEQIIRPHLERVRQDCGEKGFWLHIEDTTTLSFNERIAAEGLGWTSNEEGRGQGIFLHTGLAVEVQGWDEEVNPRVTLHGMVDQRWWVRTDPPKTRKESERARWERSRESDRWARWYGESEGPSATAEWVYVADREGDAYEIFERCAAKKVHFVIRARVDRALAEDDRPLFAAVGQSPCLGTYTIHLRKREASRARDAKLEVRATQTILRGPWRPGGWLPPYPIQVIEVKEVGAPKGVEPIHWILLTDLPCPDFRAICRIVQIYACRWLIEEYHKALKTGMGIEKTQLTTTHGITALLGIVAIAAIRLLQMKILARAQPDAPLEDDLLDSEVAAVLDAKYGRPKGGWTYASTFIAIARLGGFVARKRDGLPGWLTIWRGWQKLVALAEGYMLAKRSHNCG